MPGGEYAAEIRAANLPPARVNADLVRRLYPKAVPAVKNEVVPPTIKKDIVPEKVTPKRKPRKARATPMDASKGVAIPRSIGQSLIDRGLVPAPTEQVPNTTSRTSQIHVSRSSFEHICLLDV